MLGFLLYVLTSLLSFLAGLWAATYLQDREIRRRHLGIVRALQAETARIRRESGLDRGELIPVSVFGAKPLLPKPGSWIEALLADIASTAPRVVTQYLELDRCLDNLRATDRMKEGTQKQLQEKRSALKDAEHTDGHASIDKIAKTFPAVFEAKGAVERAEDYHEMGLFVAETAVNQAKTALSDFDTTLGALERELAAGLTTHLPWRRR